ncbi:glycosyltransferase [Hyphobacterium marinum]|uniref:Glycosyltransferase n=1 Tax=Hyphobacterium marinum TaxID=3116574 RepID=A0ABU7LZ51_9PROT|nr:glycosyltransferase [Hyphobacterium sp. Y6023]MEE2566470.1 glycosyltransferase [Hyphobacterium sp. Y6023]
MSSTIPAPSWKPGKRTARPGKADTFLFVVYFDPDGLATIPDNIAGWVSASALDYEILNLWDYGPAPLKLPEALRLDDYAGVVIHPAVCYFPHNLIGLDEKLSTRFTRYRGVKVLAKQDEHYMSYSFARFIQDNAFDILVTCVPDDQLDLAYPAPALEGVQVVHQLTAYVSDAVRALPNKPYDQRSVDIGYRGSIQPLICGRLGYEKYQIGQAVEPAARAAGLLTDIASGWESRIHGAAWGQFLANCKSVLGVESGSNLFDLDGKVSQRCDVFAKQHPELADRHHELYQLADAEFLGQYEGNVAYGQISPRHFEAAAAGSLQILYDGRYSDILLPFQHFFPLKRDLSNLAEAFDLIANADRWTEITRKARRELIEPDTYTYAGFAARFDHAVERALYSKPRRTGASPGRAVFRAAAGRLRQLAGLKKPH